MLDRAERIELGQGAWMELVPDFLDDDAASALLATLLQEEPWEQRELRVFGKPVLQPRLMSWAGCVPYRYSGQTLEPREPRPAVSRVWARVEAALQRSFNHVVINRYRDGRDYVSRHADNEPELGRDPLIASISVGSLRVLTCESRSRHQKKRVPMPHGSLLLMGGSMQHTWHHAVLRTQAPLGERVNLTFRALLGPPGWRAPRRSEGEDARSIR